MPFSLVEIVNKKNMIIKKIFINDGYLILEFKNLLGGFKILYILLTTVILTLLYVFRVLNDNLDYTS